jgi:hypothetical protein
MEEKQPKQRRKQRCAHAVLFVAHLCFSAFLDYWEVFMNHKLIRYSMQIAMIKQLLALSLITENEFHLVKNKTMRDYGIISDLTS